MTKIKQQGSEVGVHSLSIGTELDRDDRLGVTFYGAGASCDGADTEHGLGLVNDLKNTLGAL